MDKIKAFFTKNRDSIIKPTVVLICICIVISLALAVTNLITSPKIKELEIKQQNEAMQVLFDSKTKFEQKNADKDNEYYEATKDGNVIGYIFTKSASGYGGAVKVMTAVNPDGTIKAIKILDVANETPGLGQNATKENFYKQYGGLKSGIKINKTNADAKKNEISPIAGATVTSKAVTNAVNDALKEFEKINTEVAENEK